MKGLMGLELKKINLKPYVVSVFVIGLAILGMCFLFGLAPQIDSQDVSMRDGFDLIMNWNGFISVVGMVSLLAFSVMSAILHHRITVEEYVGKKNMLLLSYPIRRSKVFFCKCALVVVFTFTSMFIINLLVFLIFAIASNIFNILPETFSLTHGINLLEFTLIQAIAAVSVGLVAMGVGFLRKSMPWSIVSAFLLIAPFGNLVQYFPKSPILIISISAGLFAVLGVLVFSILMSKVNKMEAI